MFAGLRSVWVLLLGVAILSLGHGLHGSLVGVRASAENFDAGTTGLIMSGYFAGLLLSSIVTPRIVQSVGHIRVFAAFASVVSTAVLLIPLWVDPIWWFLMRFIAGLCTSGLFIVCESWLNSASSNNNGMAKPAFCANCSFTIKAAITARSMQLRNCPKIGSFNESSS